VMLPGIDLPFSVLPPYQRGDKLVVGHFGSLSATRNLRPFLRALELLSARAPHKACDVELHITGGPLDSVSADYLTKSPVLEQVRHFGRIEADPVSGRSGREQILRRMRAVDVLLLLHGQEPICEEYIPSKLYEYLWMQRPILATVHRNPQMAVMLRQELHDVVMTEEAEDGAEGLSAALERLWDQWQARGLPDNGRASSYTTAAAVARVLQFVQTTNTRGA